MRSGTVEGLNANGGVSSHRCVTVELLTGETILISTEGKTTCSAIWNRVEGELVARGVVHPQIFGLAIKAGSDWVFVDPDAKVSKYFPKEGKSTSGNNTGSITDNKAVVLYCRVHFYLEALPQSFDVVSVLHYYLQLRQNLVYAPRHTPENLIQTVALAFQAEYGDWSPGSETSGWSAALKLPKNLIAREYGSLRGMSQPTARLAFIRALMPHYNMHLYTMSLRTKEGKDAPVWIGVTPKGIEVYQNNVACMEIPEQPKVTFLWANITKLYFERKKFEIRGKACPWGGSTQKLSFTASSESVPRHLLILCRCTHQFHLSNNKMLLTAELNNQLHHGGGKGSGGTNGSNGGGVGSSVGESSSCNSTLINSTGSTTGINNKNDEKMLDLSLWADGLLLSGGGESSEHQRVSVISNASSNTTSGIVSDRVYSLDGSEEDLDLREIPYCCRESHVRDNQSTSLESLSCKHPPPPGPHNHNMNNVSKSHVCRSGSTSNLTDDSRTERNHPGNHHHHPPSSLTSSSTTSCSNNGDAGRGNHPGNPPGCCSEDADSDAKYWYCDSDCEDCDDDGPCRSSLLVQTIGEKRGCAGHCECNSCMTEELELDGHDLNADEALLLHHHTPSMLSEGTLKAGEGEMEAEEVILGDDITHPCEKEALLTLGDMSEPSGCRSKVRRKGDSLNLNNTVNTGNGLNPGGTCQNKEKKGTIIIGRRNSSSVEGGCGQKDLVDKRRGERLLQVGGGGCSNGSSPGVDSKVVVGLTTRDGGCRRKGGKNLENNGKGRRRPSDCVSESNGVEDGEEGAGRRRGKDGEGEEQERVGLSTPEGDDDPLEHVYGEISEESPYSKTDDRQYFTISGRNNKGLEGSRSGCGSSSEEKILEQYKGAPPGQKSEQASKQQEAGGSVGCGMEETGDIKKIVSRKTGKEFGPGESAPGNPAALRTVSQSVKSCTPGSKIPLEDIQQVCDCCCCPACCDGVEEVNDANVVNEDDKMKTKDAFKLKFTPSTNSMSPSAQIIRTKENGHAPKIASLKCLKTGKNPLTSGTGVKTHGLASSWLPGSVKMVGKKNALNNKKNSKNQHHHQHHYNSHLQNDYVEFGEKLTQGKYPNGRTVSDNFDTDSDYVQLPPLFPRPLPKKPASKLWRLVTKNSSSSGSSKNYSVQPKNNKLHSKQHNGLLGSSGGSCTASDSGGTPSPTPPLPSASNQGPAVNLNTLPRRHKLDHSLSVSNNSDPSSPLTKVSSKSTTALHKLGTGSKHHDKPEPPPKPLKRHVSANISKNTIPSSGEERGPGTTTAANAAAAAAAAAAIDARFIATKPQILVQTAYATPAPLGIPSQAQILFRTSKVSSSPTPSAPGGAPAASSANNNNHNSPGNPPPPIYSTKSLGNPGNYAPFSTLQHSQSVDNIYDTVAAEEPSLGGLHQGHRNTTVSIPCLTPPPYPTASKPQSSRNGVVIKTNNYIDVHASAIKNRKQYNNNHNNGPPGVGSTTTSKIGSRTGSVPNNLNNFLIGLQNLKPLSRAPIVQPTNPPAQQLNNSTMSLQHSNSHCGGKNSNAFSHTIRSNQVHHSQQAGNLHSSAPPPPPAPLINGGNYHLQHNNTHTLSSGGVSMGMGSAKNIAYVNNNGLSASTSAVNCNGNCASAGPNSRFTTVYTNQLTRSQIQQFKAQLYSDMDYVIFPPKDPRVSQQEYFDSKSLSYTTLPGVTGSTSTYGINEIPPPYLPPPPPYTAATGAVGMSMSAGNINPNYKPPRPAKNIGSTNHGNAGGNKSQNFSNSQLHNSVNNKSESCHNMSATTSAPPSHYGGPTSPPSWTCNSYGSIYNVASNISQCSSSQYGGYYSATNTNTNGSSNLNAENIQKFLSTQSLASSNVSSAPIYYPCSTQSAPPLPPYNNKNTNKIIIENEMRKAVQSQIMNCRKGIGRVSSCASGSTGGISERLKVFKSEESLYDQVHAVKQETEQKLQAMFNLPPPPPYDVNKVSPSELDLESLRAKCQALELPLLRALCSDGALLTQTKPRGKIRPTAHAHPKLAPKQLSLPPKTKPVPAPPAVSYDASNPPPLPPHLPQKPSKA